MWFNQMAIVRSAAHHIFSRHKYAIFDVHKFNQVFFLVWNIFFALPLPSSSQFHFHFRLQVPKGKFNSNDVVDDNDERNERDTKGGEITYEEADEKFSSKRAQTPSI